MNLWELELQPGLYRRVDASQGYRMDFTSASAALEDSRTPKSLRSIGLLKEKI